MKGDYCQICNYKKVLTNLFGSHFCIYCFKNTPSRIHIFGADTIGIKENLRLKHKSAFFRKFKSFLIRGYGSSEKTENGVFVYRYSDKENDSYTEIVKDYKTGEIIHRCKEKLTEHIGHGSQKEIERENNQMM